MFQASLSSSDLPAYIWPDDELARFNAYMAGRPAVDSSTASTAPGGHNGPPHTEPSASKSGAQDLPHLHAVSAERIRRAIRDDKLDRGHLKVLANLWERFSDETCTAWPSRERIAEEEGLELKSVANKLYDLKRLGYVDWGRIPDPKRPRRTLLHYWWLEDEIAAAVKELRAKTKTARPDGQKKCPPQRAVSEVPSPAGKKSALPSGNKESLSPNGEEGAHTARPNAPHLNDAGFVISAEQGLVIPMQKVEEWRDRFPHIPDLEAAMSGLATILLAKGRMHPGWTCPEGWMVKPLAEMNQEADDKRKVTAARVAKANTAGAGDRDRRRGGNSRREIDEA